MNRGAVRGWVRIVGRAQEVQRLLESENWCTVALNKNGKGQVGAGWAKTAQEQCHVVLLTREQRNRK